jgi:hypothetical protein
MIKRKVVIVLKTFSDDELTKFDEYIQAPYFNKNVQLTKLYHYIRKAFKKNISNDYRKFNDELYLKDCFKGEKQSPNTVNMNCFYLLNQVRNFIYQEGLGHKNREDFNQKLDILREIELNSFYVDRSKANESLVQIVQNEIDKGENYFDNVFAKYEYRNADYYYYRFLFSYNHSDFLNSFQREKGIEIEKMMQYFTSYFILNSLKLICFSSTRNSIFKENQFFSLKNEVIKLANSEPFKHIVSINLWLSTIELITNSNILNYSILKKLLEENDLKNIKQDEIYTIFSILKNQSTLIFQNDNLYIEMFEIYELMENNNVILALGYIPEVKIRNFIIISLHLQKTKKAEQILEKYKNKIQSQYKEDVYYTLRARILFKQKKYEEALNLLNDSIKNFPNIIFKVEVIYTLPIQIIYEQNSELLDVYLDRFNSFLHYNQDNMNKRLINAFLNFKNKLNQIKSFQKAINLNIVEKKELLSLSEEIKATNNQQIAEKEWLLEKAEELKVRFKIK